jgi:hypothetical protein
MSETGRLHQVTSRLPNLERSPPLATTPFGGAMVGKPKTQALKSQLRRENIDNLKACAAKLYIAEQQRSLASGEKKKSSRQICKDTSDAQ